jgi:hypothetical protein
MNIVSSDGSFLTTLNPFQSKYLHVDPECPEQNTEQNTIRLSTNLVDMFVMFQGTRCSCVNLISFLDSVHGIVGVIDKQFQLYNLDDTRNFTWYVEDALVNNGQELFEYDINNLCAQTLPDDIRQWYTSWRRTSFELHLSVLQSLRSLLLGVDELKK